LSVGEIGDNRSVNFADIEQAFLVRQDKGMAYARRADLAESPLFVGFDGVIAALKDTGNFTTGVACTSETQDLEFTRAQFWIHPVSLNHKPVADWSRSAVPLI
jgi:hypothetical protein